jgi:hypothetical protein
LPPGPVRIGDPIQVTGKGWGSNGSIKIKFGGQLVWEGTANADGTFSNTFNVPYVSQPNNDLVVEGSGVDDGDKTKTIAGYTVKSRDTDEPISGLSSNAAFVGDWVIVYGFDVNLSTNTSKLTLDANITPADLNANNSIDIGIDYTDTNNDGKWAASEQKPPVGIFNGEILRFQVPEIPGGRHYIGLANSSVPLDINGSIAYTPVKQKVNDEIEIEIKGFVGTVNVYVGGVIAKSGQSLDANGSAKFKFNIPTAPFGSQKLKVVDAAGHSTEVTGPTIVPRAWMSPSAGFNGGSVTLYGDGFKAVENVRLEMDGNHLTNVVTNSSGAFEYNPEIKDQPAGAKKFSARGLLSYSEDPTVYPVETNFTVHGSIKSISKLSGKKGDQVVVNIEGYNTDQSKVKVDFGGKAPAVTFGGGTDSAKGKYETQFNVPDLQHGSTVVTLSDDTERNIFAFGVESKVASNDQTVVVGQELVVEGWGFTKGTVTVDFGPHSGVATASANDNGYFKIDKFVVPATPVGKHNLVARQANTSASQEHTVQRNITKKVDSYDHATGNKTEVFVGESLNVQGTGFGANETLRVQWGGSWWSATNAVTDANGSFSLTLQAPQKPMGNYAVDIFYPDYTAGKSLNAGSLNVKPRISVANSTTSTGVPTGKAGTVITVMGDGFLPGVGQVWYTDDNTFNIAVADILADANGNFTKQATLQPNMPIGRNKLKASILGSSASKTFIYTGGSETIHATKTVVVPGDTVVISGTGYSPNASVGYLKFDGLQVSGEITANANGAFDEQITIPDRPLGNRTITLSGAGGSKTLTVNPVIILSPEKGYVDTRVMVTGRGFKTDKDIKLKFDGVEVKNNVYGLQDEGEGSLRYDGNNVYQGIRTNASGRFEVSFVIPDKYQGGKVVDATGADGENDQATFTVEPQFISANPANVKYNTILRSKPMVCRSPLLG